jgi:proteasome assembly chaperone (PAC2) family protein
MKMGGVDVELTQKEERTKQRQEILTKRKEREGKKKSWN